MEIWEIRWARLKYICAEIFKFIIEMLCADAQLMYIIVAE